VDRETSVTAGRFARALKKHMSVEALILFGSRGMAVEGRARMTPRCTGGTPVPQQSNHGSFLQQFPL